MGRARGSLISNIKSLRNIRTFTELYHSCVVPVNDYCAGIWGAGRLPASENVQNRAARFFLGVHKFTSNHVVHGDMGWEFCHVRRKIEMLRFWNRCLEIDDERLTKKIFMIDYSSCVGNWCSEIKNIFIDIDCRDHYDQHRPIDLKFAQQILHNRECSRWRNECQNKPKLRSYILFKTIYETELYVKLDISRSKRSLFAQLRSSTLPLMIEVGRFRNLAVDERVCPLCNSGVEDEFHFLFSCQIYNIERANFFSDVVSINTEFMNLTLGQRMAFMMTQNCIKLTINFVSAIFHKRQFYIYT